MYVCLCNAITDRDVRGHTAGEDCSVVDPDLHGNAEAFEGGLVDGCEFDLIY